MFIRSTGKGIECRTGAHCATMTTRGLRTRALSQNDNNKDNNSILLSPPLFSPFLPFLQEESFSVVTCPIPILTLHNAPLSRPFHLYLMHRGIAKRISDFNTGSIMREIKLASTLYRKQVSHTSVTPKWIKCFSPASD